MPLLPPEALKAKALKAVTYNMIWNLYSAQGRGQTGSEPCYEIQAEEKSVVFK